MCHGGALTIVFKLASLITALAAIKIGAHEMGYDVMGKLGVMQGTPSAMYIHYIIGAAGLLVLAKLAMCAYGCMTGACKECKSGR
jgi:hypothetical protein